MVVNREVIESPTPQGIDEIIAYTLDTEKWGGSAANPPTSPSVVVYDVTGGTYDDVTLTVMPAGSPSVSDSIITLPALKLLEEDTQYRIEIEFTISGNVFEAFGIVDGEK